MKKYIINSILLISLLTITVSITAQNTQAWEKVDQLIEKDLPESALKAIDSISRIAEATNNQQEQIKVRLYRYRIQTEKEPNTSPAVLKDFEQFAEAFEPSAIKQLLFCMAAEMYHNYYQNKRFEIDRRTDVAGLLPQNIETWSKNHFQQKVKSLIDEAWKEQRISQQTDIESLQKLFILQSEKKEDINTTPTLFDYIAYKRIDLAEAWKDEKTVQETYKELIQFQKKQGDTNLTVLAEINYLDYLHGQSDSQTFIQKADSLEQVYLHDPAVVEIMAQKARHYLHNAEIPQHKKLAHAMCKKGIETFPDYPRIGLLHNILAQIEQQSLFIESAADAAPSGKFKLNIRSTNIPAITLEIYRLSTSSEDFARHDLNKEIDSSKDPFDKTLIETLTFNLPLNADYEAVDSTFNLQTGEYGIYEYIAYPTGMREKDKMTKSYYTVTDLTFIKRAVSEGKNAYYVLNRITGKQVKQVEITSYKYKWTDNQYVMTPTATGKTNSKGYVELPRLKSSGNEIIVLKKKDDRYFSTMSHSPYFSKFKPTETTQQRVNIFTDRAIYRPGQTIYFKAIAYEMDSKKQEVTANKNIRFELIDVNGKSISQLELSTNEFGSASGSFVLPSGGLNGNYLVRADNLHEINILVEEYKRPTFEVTVTQPAAEISFGEVVTLNGEVKAFAGYSLPDTKVKYVINRYVHPFWRWFPPNRIEAMIASGETTTDAKGKFSIQFTPEIDKSIRENRVKQAYRYTITIDATDSKGESQQTIAHLSVSEQSLFILADVPELIQKQDTSKFKVSTQNIAGEKIHKSIRYQLFSLKETTDYRENLKSDTAFTTDKLMTEGTYDTQSAHLTLNLKKYPSGRYKLIFTTNDKHGNPVESEHIFILYDKKENRSPVKTYVWLPENQFESLPGEKVNIRFGTSVKCAHVLMEVKHGNELISSRWLSMNNNIRTFSIPFATKHRGGVTVDFTFVRDEQVFQESVRITEKIIEKKLTPKLTVFRDKLLPGEAATWTVNIPEVAAKGKIAELLAGMYDASLDELKPHQWLFNPVYRIAFPDSYNWIGSQNYRYIYPINNYIKYHETPAYFRPEINWYGLYFKSFRDLKNVLVRGTKRAASLTISITNEDANKVATLADKDLEFFVNTVQENEKRTQPSLSPRIRSNFNETVFFYPHLQGDNTGNYQFSFTMPESLTRWNLKMLAHTKDLYFGQEEAQLITQQDLMVQLNMPRFVRQSDKLTLQASLVNLSDKALKTNVKLTLIDPTTDQAVLLNDTNMIAVDVPADGKPLTLSWDVSGFDQYEWLICKVVADAGNFSDGEQRYLAILPDKVLVTESYPVFIGNEATKELKLDAIQELVDKVDTRQLTFEFSANPVWYAIQALPALAKPKNENAVDYFIAWYVNALAGNILLDNPRIKTIFEQIKQTEPGSIQSALNKNQELKNILLEETPWLTEAKNETEQQQRIALLFDLNQQEQLKSRYLDKLSTLQLPNGAFSWFDGMGESRWVTQFIAEGLLKAREFTDINIINRMLGPAMNYLEGQITKDYLQVKKQVKDYEKKMNINSLQLHFLSLRTKINAPEISADSKEAMVFYIKETEQYYNKFGLYDKALAAMILHHANKPDAVDAIIKTLKENSLRTTDKGMYWSKNTAGYRWNERPISVQVKLMEAFNLVPGNETELALMKTWLLRQKQTQQWESPVASVNAIYALTGIGNNLLNNKQSFSITAGKKTFDTNQGIPGTGYIKQTLAKEDIREGITINRVNQPETASPAWGALYWQYYQEMDKVRSSGSALQVEKQLFVERIVDNRKTLFPINGQNVNATLQSIQKGDKLIARMVVTTDRDLEFVVLKDNRAANLEPVSQLSGCSWKEGVVYYRTVKDASTQYFFSHLPKGTYVFEDEYFVNASGNFSGGTASIQCLYAPEFVGVGKGERVEIR